MSMESGKEEPEKPKVWKAFWGWRGEAVSDLRHFPRLLSSPGLGKTRHGWCQPTNNRNVVCSSRILALC